MRSSLRLLNREVTPLQGPRSLYVCSVCRQETRSRPLIARQFLRNASDSSSITERVRRKIWGTDNPPGLKDPYGGEGVFEKKFKKGREARQVEPEEEQGDLEKSQGAGSEAVAETAEDLDSTYEPATTWEGLQRIGHLGRWNDTPPTEADVFTSFSSNRRLTKPGLLYLAAHQTAVELSVLHSLQKPLTRICDVAEHEEAVFELLYNCRVQPKSGGEWDSALDFPDKETEEALVYVFEQIAQPAAPAEAVAEEGITSGEAEKVGEVEEVDEAEFEEPEPVRATGGDPFFGHTHSPDNGFLTLSLADPATKFAFVKRFSQLTGHHLPDPIIASARSIQNLMDHVLDITKPKPKKLAQELASDKSLKSLPNVKIFAKRQGPRDKDEELGRRKLIAAELRERGLN
ncbi:ribosomal subunit 39S-domain-containing protein [Aspergillus crustosus]